MRLHDVEYHRRLHTSGRSHMHQICLGVWYQLVNGNENSGNSNHAGVALHAIHPPYAVENLGSGSGLCGKCFACLDAHKGCQLVHSSRGVLRVCKGITFRGMIHTVYAKGILQQRCLDFNDLLRSFDKSRWMTLDSPSSWALPSHAWIGIGDMHCTAGQTKNLSLKLAVLLLTS